MSRGPFSHGIPIPSSPSPYARTGSGGGGIRGGGGPAGGSIGGSGMGGGSISSSVSSGYSGSMVHASSDSAPAGWHQQHATQRAPAGKSCARSV